MRWFGESWGAPVNVDTPHTATPVGARCDWCEEPFVDGDQGVLMPYVGPDELLATGEDGALRWVQGTLMLGYHLECHLRQIVGGANHIEGRCTCQGGSEEPDPPELTRREAARAAIAAWERTTGQRLGR